MAETQTYSRTEIQRYLQHKMSAQEMYEFEKTLMNDPFLRMHWKVFRPVILHWLKNILLQ